MGERRIVRALGPFSVQIAGVPVMVSSGDLYYADDPVVKGREGLFGDVSIRNSRGPRETASVTGNSAVVETMTAEPGEKRRLGRPATRTRVEDLPRETVTVVPSTSEV